MSGVRFDRGRQGLTLASAEVEYPAFHYGPVDLAVVPGELVALVGANGAGKTTTLDLLAGRLAPRRGGADCGGDDTEPPALRCGYVTDADDLPCDLTARELWALVARTTAGRRGAAALLDGARTLAGQFDFVQEDQLIGTLSHGNRQKVKLIAAFMVAPGSILLDEPRNGLDPVAMHRLDEHLAAEAARGAALLVATHDLHYAQRAATRVIALHRGRVAHDGPVADLPGGSLVTWYVELATADA